MPKFRTIAIEQLHQSLKYNSETGEFMRKIDPAVRGSLKARWHNKPTSKTVNNCGYSLIGICGKQYLAHRVAWAMYYGKWPEGQIDHINHIRTDNRIKNLREVDDQENKKNLSLISTNKTGVMGVSWDKNRSMWRSRIQIGQKGIFLGRFNSFDEAVTAREKALEQHGFHANHGGEMTQASNVGVKVPGVPVAARIPTLADSDGDDGA